MRVLLGIVMAGSLAACSNTPRTASSSHAHAALVLPADTSTESPSEARVSVTQELPSSWWRLYNDPALDRLIAQALAANTSLRAADAHLAAALAVLGEVRGAASLNTTLSAAAINGRDVTVDLVSEATGHHSAAQWVYSAGLDVSYEVDLAGRVRSSIAAAGADAATAAATRDVVRVAVAAETTRAYATTCAVGAQLSSARRNVTLAERSLDSIHEQQALGAASDFDAERSAAFLETVRSAVPPLEGRREAAMFELTALLGKEPADAPPDVQGCVAPLTLSAALPVGDGASLIRRRPDIRQAESRLAASTARIGVAMAALYPRIELLGSIGATATKVNLLGSQDARTVGIGPFITWSFPNLTVVRQRIIETRADAAAALAEFDGAILNALAEVEQSLALYSAEMQRRDALEAALTRSASAFHLAEARQRYGTLSQFELLSAEQTLVGAEEALAASDTTLSDLRVNVFKALGGGWHVE